ncbi:hypothetical protein [Paraflavitalea sp. CAU 1676]|uniref:hypothetical protein n=1 Tax=Paraflavitalea sp. CAU 1676 TaxID=3032598 RepID=UPI0023DCC246|nr:hypothetical protein [Paraflavitalea sp. CAU 1676]MDF2189331.1 hypothetical protein [Paraflavitalea sp. CAU 1676]
MRNIALLAVLLLSFVACKKENDEAAGDNHRVMSIFIYQYQPPNIGNRYWAIDAKFDKPVTLKGTVVVTFDVFDRGALYKSHEITVPLDLNNELFEFYQTDINPNTGDPSIKNVKIKALTVTSGDYHIDY